MLVAPVHLDFKKCKNLWVVKTLSIAAWYLELGTEWNFETKDITTEHSLISWNCYLHMDRTGCHTVVLLMLPITYTETPIACFAYSFSIDVSIISYLGLESTLTFLSGINFSKHFLLNILNSACTSANLWLIKDIVFSQANLL